MANANFYKLFISFVLLGVIVFSYFSFGVLFQAENDVENPFIDDSRMSSSFGNLTEDLSSFRDEAQTQRELFESENPTAGVGSLLLFSIVRAGKIFGTMIVGTFNTIIILPAVVLGVDSIIIGVFSAIILVTMLIGLWALFKLGG